MKQIVVTRDPREAKLKVARGWIVRVHIDGSDTYLAANDRNFREYENRAEFVCMEM